MQKIAPIGTGKSLGVTDEIQGPVWNIPDNLLHLYTMGGMSQVIINWFYGDTGSNSGFLDWVRNDDEPGSWSWCLNAVDQCKLNSSNIYYPSDHFLPSILEKYSIKDKSVMVVGSATPLYEAFVYKYGGHPVTVEYRPIDHQIEALKTYTLDEAVNAKIRTNYAMSISSIEHAGLGRYGDVLDPDADIKTMRFIRQSIDDDGLLFLQIPVGVDTLVWNAQRIYGQYRLAKLFEGWELLEIFGFEKYYLIDRNGYEGVAEPIFILKKSDVKEKCRAEFIRLLL